MNSHHDPVQAAASKHPQCAAFVASKVTQLQVRWRRCLRPHTIWQVGGTAGQCSFISYPYVNKKHYLTFVTAVEAVYDGLFEPALVPMPMPEGVAAPVLGRGASGRGRLVGRLKRSQAWTRQWGRQYHVAPKHVVVVVTIHHTPCPCK